MRADSVIAWFGGNQSAVAKALGLRKAAVSKWKKSNRVPPLQAARLDRLTGGALKFNPDEYVPAPASKDRSAA